MSDLHERILDVLERHEDIYWNHNKGTVHCDCHAKLGEARKLGGHDATHRAHVAEMLAPIIRDAQREAWHEGYTRGNRHDGRRDDCPYEEAS